MISEISKELFVKTLNEIQKGRERIQKASDALKLIADGWPVITLGEEYLNASLELLANAVGDKDCDMISWWLFEDVEKKVWLKPNSYYNKTDKEIEIDVSTPELLYEYFEKYND
jgi:hypothetical protein